ncbi:MAG TPA: Bcr/CflA family drug resistance efflux transporter, partial [Verrucomicrobiota bacterium]|nr:Bcr/CflA family drug resistance efflux transporter [Verrucomicrobiota bacterium]
RARGTAASGFTFGQLVINSLVAVALLPLVDATSTTMALACLVIALLGGAMWVWTLRTDLRSR